jgi:hypothetical protein
LIFPRPSGDLRIDVAAFQGDENLRSVVIEIRKGGPRSIDRLINLAGRYDPAEDGGRSMSVKTKGGVPYKIERRMTNKRTGAPLSGYAVDITVRVNGDGAYFLQDQNSERSAMPHNDREELVATLLGELERNHAEHFGQA